MKHLITLLLIGLVNCSFSQTTTIFRDKVIGGPSTEGFPIVLFEENQLLISGTSNTIIGNDKTDSLCVNPSISLFLSDFWFLELADTFNIVTDLSIGGSNSERCGSFLKSSVSDKLYICGSSTSNISCEKSENNKAYPFGGDDYWLVAMDTSNNIIFDKTFGGTNDDTSPRLIELQSGNLILAGSSVSPVGQDKSDPGIGMDDYWIVKSDTLGNKIWDITFGGTDAEITLYPFYFDMIALEQSDQFIIAGSTESPVSGTITVPPIGGGDILVVKFDSSGNDIWQKRYGGSLYDQINTMAKCPDGGFIIGGKTNSPLSFDVSQPQIGLYDAWLLKIDSAGNKLWDKRYGGLNNDIIIKIKPTSNGYYVLCSTRSDAGFDISESPYGLVDYWFMEVDSVGNKLWDKRFGGPGTNNPSGFIIFADTSFLLFGESDSGTTAVKTEPGYGGRDFWMIHFKHDMSTGISEIPNKAVKLFPNPSPGTVTLPLELLGYDLEINDLTGRLISRRQKIDSYILDLAPLENGMYSLRFMKGNESYTGKVILLK